MTLDADLRGWIILIAANLPVYLILGRVFFGDWLGFVDSIRANFTSDLISLFRGEFWADQWATLKLLLFGTICASAVYAEHRFFFSGPAE